jgi:hypothetical protein
VDEHAVSESVGAVRDARQELGPPERRDLQGHDGHQREVDEPDEAGGTKVEEELQPVLFGVRLLRHFVERHFVEGHFVERHFEERHFAERHFEERHFAERHFEERHFAERHFEERHFVERHFEERHFAERHFEERHFEECLKWCYVCFRK